CGIFTGIGYPFWRNDQPDYCGHPGFKLDCEGERATIDINSQKYDINEIYHESQVLRIAKTDFMLNICRVSFINSTLDFNLFEYTLSDQNASLLYDCDHLTEEQPRKREFTCPINNRSSECYFTVPAISSDELSRRCKISLLIPVLEIFADHFTNYLMTIDQVIKEGFEVRWIIDQERCRDCHFSGGKCGYNRTINDFTCFCSHQPSPRTCFRTQPPANSAAANPSTAPVFVHLNKTKRLVVQNHEASLFPPPILNPILTFMICFLIAVTASQGDGDVDELYMSCNRPTRVGTYGISGIHSGEIRRTCADWAHCPSIEMAAVYGFRR
ncbi:hypothetical protein CICLE_v10024220mg, partial [Citrus x clementina]